MEKINLKTNLKKKVQKKTQKNKQNKAAKKDIPLMDNKMPLFKSTKERWSFLKKDMSSALSHWEDLSKKFEGKTNPDEEQLLKVKKLLKELQKRINSF